MVRMGFVLSAEQIPLLDAVRAMAKAGWQMKITCEKELGKWAVRVNGWNLISFWRKGKAFELAYRLANILTEKQETK